MLDEDEKASIEKVYNFFSNHIFIKNLKKYSLDNKNIVISEFELEFLNLYSDKNIQEKTLRMYYKKLLKWAFGLGIIDFKSERDISVIAVEQNKGLRDTPQKILIQNKLYPFFGSAPATRLLELLNEIENGEKNEVILNKKKLRNAITTAVTLGLAYRNNGDIELSVDPSLINLEYEIANRVLQTETIQLIAKYFDENKDLPKRDWVGKRVNELLNKNWIASSEKRNGSALLNWYIWSMEKIEMT